MTPYKNLPGWAQVILFILWMVEFFRLFDISQKPKDMSVGQWLTLLLVALFTIYILGVLPR